MNFQILFLYMSKLSYSCNCNSSSKTITWMPGRFRVGSGTLFVFVGSLILFFGEAGKCFGTCLGGCWGSLGTLFGRFQDICWMQTRVSQTNKKKLSLLKLASKQTLFIGRIVLQTIKHPPRGLSNSSLPRRRRSNRIVEMVPTRSPNLPEPSRTPGKHLKLMCQSPKSYTKTTNPYYPYMSL